MAIIIGDIHGVVAKAEAFLSYKPEEGHIVLGDLVDCRRKGVTLQEERACLELLLGSSAILLWGNHDLSYLPERPWRCYGNFGEDGFRDLFETNRNRFVAAWAVDGWLCTHAGISARLAKVVPVEVLAGGVEVTAAWINAQFVEQIRTPQTDVVFGGPRYGCGALFWVPVCRGGFNECGGIFWGDCEGEQTQPAPLVGPQIFGHCPVRHPVRGDTLELRGGEVHKGPSWINLNAETGVWVYDTQRDEIVDIQSGRRL